MSAYRTNDAYRVLAMELEGYRLLTYGELVQLAGESFVHRRTLQVQSVEYEVTIRVRRIGCTEARVLVEGTIGLANWGSPASRLDDEFVVDRPSDDVPA